MQHSRRKGTCSNDQRRTQKPVGVTSCQFDADLWHHFLRHESPIDFGLRGFFFTDQTEMCTRCARAFYG